MEIDKSCILLTGASGFVGSALVVKLIESGVYRLICPVRSSESRSKLEAILSLNGLSIDSPNLEIIECSLASYIDLMQIMSGVDCLIHAAAKVELGSVNHSENMIGENCFNTSVVVEAAIDSKIGRIIHLSSIAVLESENGEAITEKSTPQNINKLSPYAISKFYSENYVWSATSRGVEVSILMPSVIIGSGNGVHKGSAMLTKIFSIKQPFYAKGVTGYVALEDVVRAVMLMITRSDNRSRRYLLSSENLSYRQLQHRLSGSCPTVAVASWILKIVKLKLSIAQKLGLKLAIKSSMMDTLTSKSIYDGSLITKELGFEYSKITQKAKSRN